MKKKLLALAIGAVAALPVAAFATGPTLYGQIDLSVENVNDNMDSDAEVGNDGVAPTNDANTYVLRDNASRLGVKGEADTDIADLKGIYKAEFGLEADDGSTAFDQRDIYVGLAHESLGTLKMGNFDTPLKKAQGSVDQFNDSTLDITRYVANETRSADIIQYSSPVIADLVTVNVALTTEEGVGTGNDRSANSVSVVYDKDGLYLALAVDNDMENDSDYGAEIATGVETDATRVVVGYSADGFEVGFLYQMSEQEVSPTVDAEDTSMVLSGALKAGKWKFKAQYGMTEGDDGLPTVPGDADDELTSMAFGADYMLGKATTAYALLGTEELDDGIASNQDLKRDVFGVGLRHKF